MAQHHEIVPDTELGQQRVDRPNLYAFAAAGIPNFGRADVIVPIGHDPREHGQMRHDTAAGSGAGETLEELLHYEPGREHRVTTLKGARQSRNLWHLVRRVSAHGQRPHAGIDEQVHDRDRSALYS